MASEGGGTSRPAPLPPGPAPRPRPRRLAPGPGLGCGSRPLPPQEVSVRGQFPPVASAAASLGAAGGGNSLALTLGWMAPASRWARTEHPGAGGRGWAICVPTSSASVRPAAYLSFLWARHPSVTVAKGEGTSETKVSEKERRFPAPAGAVSRSPRSRASGSAPVAPRKPGRAPAPP